MRTCPTCAQPIPDDTAMFCPHCGAAAPMPPSAAAPMPPQPINYPPGPYAGAPTGAACPFCGYQGPPVFSKKRLSTGGWVLFAALLVLCCPLCWLPFVIDGCKEDEWMCPSCHIKRA